jgi:CheY-like chemotaxis protein
MSEDLVSLRMLLVGAAQANQELWRQATALASVMFEFSTPDAASAARTLARNGADICVLDAALSDNDKATVIGAARAAKPAPLIFASAAQGSPRLESVDGQLSPPVNVSEARKLVEICVRAKFPTRVLVVDDSGTMRSIVRKIMSASHFTLELHEAAEGMAALEQLRAGNFGMVFLDYNMPGLNGFETLSQIKQEMPKVAVVIISSSLENDMVGRAKAGGALAFLKKPFYPSHIDTILERYYGLHVSP